MLLKLAVTYLCYRLKKDKDYWFSWKSNIAMSIMDNYNWFMPLTAQKSSPTLHEWCNICAEHFLTLLTKRK